MYIQVECEAYPTRGLMNAVLYPLYGYYQLGDLKDMNGMAGGRDPKLE